MTVYSPAFVALKLPNIWWLLISMLALGVLTETSPPSGFRTVHSAEPSLYT